LQEGGFEIAQTTVSIIVHSPFVYLLLKKGLGDPNRQEGCQQE
jgi:hypothetical protein